MNSYKLQTRYAQSLFDLALEQGISDIVYKDMQCVMQVCMQNREFRVILKNPVIKPSDKRNIVKEIFNGKVEGLSLAFMDLLIKKRRDVLLYEVE